MSLIKILKDESAKWDREPPANKDVIRSLIEESRLELPEEYITFLRYSNGGKGELEIQPWWFRVWPAEEVIEANRDYEMKHFLPHYFGFGSSGGGDLLIFQTTSGKPWPV